MLRRGRGYGRGGRSRRAALSGPDELRRLFAALPAELRTRAVTHSSWTGHRADSYGRLAFLGDSVLGLAIAEHLFMSNPRADIGRLTKIHGQAVSGRACAAVAGDLGLPEHVRAAAPTDRDGAIDPDSLLASERALASICESAIGACYIEHGYEGTAPAVVAAFAEQVELATGTLLDFKSALQEALARSGGRVRYDVVSEDGPPHRRRYEVQACVDGEVLGVGAGNSKKAAEQAAAEQALERLAR
jgi:ribonuclease III